jgi:hypothetical protein
MLALYNVSQTTYFLVCCQSEFVFKASVKVLKHLLDVLCVLNGCSLRLHDLELGCQQKDSSC